MSIALWVRGPLRAGAAHLSMVMVWNDVSAGTQS